MTSIISRKGLAAAVTFTLALQPVAASAQQACVTEQEVSAMAIYSVPQLVQAVRTQCGAQLSTNGYLARSGDSFVGRYVRLQSTVWPRAKAGLIKYGASKAKGSPQNIEMFTSLPDSAVRPLVDALILQEASSRIQTRHCSTIERMIQTMAPVDPEVAGTLLGLAIGLAAPQDQPICPAARS